MWCDRTLFQSPVYFGLCTSEVEFQKQMRKMNVPATQWPAFIMNGWSHATAHIFEKGDGKICVIVCIHPSDRDGIVIAGLLVHEAVHIWQEIRRISGEDKPSCEFEAYAIQSISQELMEQYRLQCCKKTLVNRKRRD